MYIENPSAKHCTITDPGGHGAAQAACRQSVPWIDEVFRCFSGYWDVVYGYWLPSGYVKIAIENGHL